MSQPAVSEAIANLEAALRVRLLDRSPRGVEPTIYAAALLKRERVVFDELQQGIKEIEFLLNPTAGEVRLGTTEVLAAGLVPEGVDRLSRRHPQTVIRVVLANPRADDLLGAPLPPGTSLEDVFLEAISKEEGHEVAEAEETLEEVGAGHG